VLSISARPQPGDGTLLEQIHASSRLNQRRLLRLDPLRLEQRLAQLAERCVQLPEGLIDRLSDRLERDSCVHPVAGLLAFLAVIAGDVPADLCDRVRFRSLSGWASTGSSRFALFRPWLPLACRTFVVAFLREGLWLGQHGDQLHADSFFIFLLIWFASDRNRAIWRRAAF